MKVGNLLEIGPYGYEVLTSDDVKDDKNNELYGDISYQNNKIRINNKASFIKQNIALLHEALHGIDDNSCLKLEEHQVEVLANRLYDFLKRNQLLNEKGFDKFLNHDQEDD